MKEFKFSKEKKAEKRFYVMQKVIYVLTVVTFIAFIASNGIILEAKGIDDGLQTFLFLLNVILTGAGFCSTFIFSTEFFSYEYYRLVELERTIAKREKKESRNIWII